MADKAWKVKERQVAALVGAVRTPLSGSNSGTGTSSDTSHGLLYIEQRHRKRHSVLGWYKDAAEKAKREGKVPYITLTESGSSEVFIVCPADSGTLRILLDEMTKAERAREFKARLDNPPSPSLTCSDLTDAAPRWPERKKGLHDE